MNMAQLWGTDSCGVIMVGVMGTQPWSKDVPALGRGQPWVEGGYGVMAAMGRWMPSHRARITVG